MKSRYGTVEEVRKMEQKRITRGAGREKGEQEDEDEEVAETWVVGGAVQKQSRAGAGEAGRAKGELIPEVGKTFHAGLMHSMGSQSRG